MGLPEYIHMDISKFRLKDKKMSQKNPEPDSADHSDNSEHSEAEPNAAEASYLEKDYADADLIPFNELLHTHHKQTVWGFKFGKEVMKRAQENMRLARDKHTTERLRLLDGTICDPAIVMAETCYEDDEPEEGTKEPTEKEKEHKTPHSRKRQKLRRRKKRVKAKDIIAEAFARRTPLPLLCWADSNEVWSYMVYKEEASLTMRNPRLFEDFTNLLPRMRAILLDWIMEVCEVYHLRRVTYYLSVDYFDRFLSIRPDVPKNQLQLVGVTCLFLAAKLEEVCPPKLTEFSYVCDGACTPEEILACELLILNSLGWDLNLMTPSDWLNLYMQIHFKADKVTKQKMHSDVNKDFLYPQFSGYQFTRASQLIDLCSLDPGFLKFSYSTIAASAMYFMYGKRAALAVSGLTWDQLKHCAEYMAVFYQVIRNSSDPKLQSCTSEPSNDRPQNGMDSVRTRVKGLVPDENHSFQTHVVNVEYFEKAAITRLEQMGLKVQKVAYRRPVSPSVCGGNPDADPTDVSSFNYDVLYEVEKLCENQVLLGSDCERVDSDADLILSPNNDMMTLDEMVEGLVRCNAKNIPVSSNRPDSPVQSDDESDIVD